MKEKGFKAATLLVCLPALLYAANSISPGLLTAPYPTIINLALEIPVTGDDNNNATATVQYRMVGETDWQQGMPLKRIPAGSAAGGRGSWSSKISGSIFDLKPGTTYEIRVSINDPDGGSTIKTITASTRPVPRIDSTCEIIECPDGYNGVLAVRQDGTAEKPLVYRSLSRKAIYGGITIGGRRYVYLEGLVIKGPDGEPAGGISFTGAFNCVIRRCSVYTGGFAMRSSGVATNMYISDNVIIGPEPWEDEFMGASGTHYGEGIITSGPGNVICHNYVKGFEDCISTWNDAMAINQKCIDIYNNDIEVGTDDAIEADFTMGNCRIMRNRITNSFTQLSSQPSLGGPTYFIRNVMFNAAYVPYKFANGSYGNVSLHNMVVKFGDGMACFNTDTWDYCDFRNNMAIAGPNPGVPWTYGPGSGMAVNLPYAGSHCTFDYDAVGSYNKAYATNIAGASFASKEPHGVERIGSNSSDFAKLFNGVQFPDYPIPAKPIPDLRPKAGSPIIDKGLAIPNINDGYAGSAPDIGAYEFGQELPTYGPRPPNVDELTPYEVTQIMPAFSSGAEKISLTAFPNPFRSNVIIRAFAGNVIQSLKVYDVSGRMVYESAVGTRRAVSELNDYHVWKGVDNYGRKVANGNYFVKVNTINGEFTPKVNLVR